MRAFHDSRNSDYRLPYGAVSPGEPVTLSLDVYDAEVEEVALRTWVEGRGEGLYAMEAVSPTRYRLSFTPEAAGVVWYYFLITTTDGTQRRYGVPEGRRGGEGLLYDWEPPSFQLTVCGGHEAIEALENQTIGCSMQDVFVRFLCDELSAVEFAEAFETMRENCFESDFLRALDLLGQSDCVQLLARLGGVTLEDGLEEDAHASDVMESGQLGLAKGRLWCASLIQLLAAGMSEDAPETTGDTGPYDRAIDRWAAEDADCEAIMRNAVELRFMLPLFDGGVSPLFAVNDGVIGFWCHGADGASACVLVNSSLSNAYDVQVPMVDECASEVIAGYGMPVVSAEEAGEVPAVFADADRYACVHLYQLGSAILYFHGAERLEEPMDPGVGVLAHITSLPAAAKGEGPGTLSDSTRSFIDWLARAGVRYWQILPVNPTDDHGSPYAGISAFAGNVRLLEDYPDLDSCAIDQARYEAFCKREADWLDPYACFMAIREKVGAGVAWQDWPKKYRRFDKTLLEVDSQLAASAEAYRRGQFVFEERWKDLRAYANDRGVRIVGDMPIYVSADSSDVWAHPGIFQLGTDGKPEVVAGCPPDSFAVDGQVWGNPVYDWAALAADGYSWWLRRLERAFDLYDFVRLDHFIGFARYFSIPSGEKACKGKYHPGPGVELFRLAFETFGPLPVIAEDLGSITPSVRALVAACGFPGMDIVQFVDGGDPLSGYHPRPEKIVYTGTHDNQTIVGYCETRYPDLDALSSARTLVERAVSCEAPVCVIPLQDVLELDDEARMNEPGTVEGNWVWQTDADDVEKAHDRMKHLCHLHEDAQARVTSPAN